MTTSTEDGFHLRVREGRMLLLPVDLPSAYPFETRFEESWLDGVVGRARRLVPGLRDVAIDLEHCRAGLYEVSPDRHAIVGKATGLMAPPGTA